MQSPRRFVPIAPIAAVAILLLFAATPPTATADVVITTNLGIGADAEVRESNPTQNRGSSTELATRVANNFIAGSANDSSDRNSAIYTRFDLTQPEFPDSFTTSFRLTYRNNNINASRIEDTITPNPAVRTGIAVYALNNFSLGNWDESTITYLNAPGIFFDGDVGTKDFNSDLTFLGTVLFPEVDPQLGHLPVGQELIFHSALLDQFVANAIAGGETSVTLVTTILHGGDTPFPVWLNFNYLFNPKEQTTLNTDTGSPFSGADNSTGNFSPALILEDTSVAVPEPATALLAISAAATLFTRRSNRRNRNNS